VIAKALWYGMSRRLRSSRQIEYALNNHLDFMWLVECRSIDHSTLSKFRQKFGKELKSLFRQLG
jgi:transposase